MLFKKGELVTMTPAIEYARQRHAASDVLRPVRGVVTEDQSAGSPHVLVRWFYNGTVASAPADWMIRMKNAV